MARARPTQRPDLGCRPRQRGCPLSDRVTGADAPSGHYEWLTNPISKRAQEDARLLRLIRASFTASQGIYGAPRVFLDLREAGETCSKHRVARLMRENNLRALHGYRIRRWSVGKPSILIPNILQRQFTVTRRNKAWVSTRRRWACNSSGRNNGSGRHRTSGLRRTIDRSAQHKGCSTHPSHPPCIRPCKTGTVSRHRQRN